MSQSHDNTKRSPVLLNVEFVQHIADLFGGSSEQRPVCSPSHRSSAAADDPNSRARVDSQFTALVWACIQPLVVHLTRHEM